MNREVYKHLLSTYGRKPGIWFGLVCELIRTFVVRVYVVIVMAQVATSIAAGNLEAAKRYTLYYLIVYVLGAGIGLIGELVSINTENRHFSLSQEYFSVFA